MPRPHVEFLQAQALPWLPVGTAGFRPGADQRLLSQDPDSDASSNLLRYPEGWALQGAQRLACDEELFVLHGQLVMGERRYGPGDYAYLPAGYRRPSLSAPGGAIALTFLEGRPQALDPDDDRLLDPGTETVEQLRTGDQAWGGATEPAVAGPGVGRKLLKPDNALGERTWILSMEGSEERPLEVNGIEQHPCVEEMYLLAGSFHMPCGVMRAGAYFWRPPMIKHGPMGAREPFLALFRAKEGAFSTQWSGRGSPVPWDRPYRPTLPRGVTAEGVPEAACNRPW